MPNNFTVDEDDKNQPIDIDNLIDSNTSVVKFSRKMKNKKNDEDRRISGKLTVFQKLCFGVGGLPYEMTSNCLGLFLPAFMLEIARLSPSELAVILFSGKVWDAITDPIVGYIVSKTSTRFGKLRPWIIFFAPFAVISYLMIWYVPKDIDALSKVYWYLGAYCLFQTFLSCLHVPYTSLTMYLTHNQKERDSATGYRMGLEVFGVFLAATIQGIMITIYGAKSPCPSIANDTILNQFTNEVINKNSNTLEEGYLLSAVIMSTIYVFCCITTFFGTKEIDDVITDKNNHFIRSLGSVFQSKAYITLLLSFLFNSAASKLLQTNFALFCKHSIKAKDQYQLIIICLLVAIILSMPIWQYIIKNLGKKITYAIGLLTFIPNLIPLYFITDEIWFMYVITVFCGFSMASHFLLPWSMLPDVIDDYMIKTGDRKESIFFSFFVFFAKFSSGIAAGFSQLYLKSSGYKDCPRGCCTQPEEVKVALRELLVHMPVAMIFISLIFLYMHPINEKTRKNNKLILEEMRSKSRDALINTKY